MQQAIQTPCFPHVYEWGLIWVHKRYTHKIFETFLNFFSKAKHRHKEKGKICAHVDRFYQLNNLATKPHTFKTYVGHKCISILIFHPTQENDTICTPWSFVKSVLTLNATLKLEKSHLHLAYDSLYFALFFLFFFFFRFSPYVPSPRWIVLGLLRLELLDEQLSTCLDFLHI